MQPALKILIAGGVLALVPVLVGAARADAPRIGLSAPLSGPTALLGAQLRDGAAVAALDVLRTRLLQALADNAWTRVAVTAPRRGCGTTFVAINLALSVARVRSVRAVLVDLDLRKPDMAARFGVSDAGSLAAFLAADQPVEAHLRRHGRNLALGLNSEPVMASAEILQQPETAETLEDMIDSLLPDIVLYDLPPVLEGDDLLAFLPQVDGVLLVADGTRTVGKDLAECERLLEGRAPLIGVVLNRGELRRGDLHARTGE